MADFTRCDRCSREIEKHSIKYSLAISEQELAFDRRIFLIEDLCKYCKSEIADFCATRVEAEAE